MLNSILNFLRGFCVVLFNVIYSLIAPWLPKSFIQKKVRNQILLVTGGGSGFGQLLAKKFSLDHGATVIIWDINEKGMEETMKIVKAGGGKCFSYVVDVSSREEIYAAATRVEAEVGKVDILINNAGTVDGLNLMDTLDERIVKMFQVNILAHFWTVKAFLPAMISRGSGHIVTVASAAGLHGVPRLTHYCATKHAAVGFHDALTNELIVSYPDAKIETTVICPYFVRTPMVAGQEHLLPPGSAFLPIREPEPVVDEMVDAILSNQNILIPSRGVRILLLLKANVPARLVKELRNVLIRMPQLKSEEIKKKRGEMKQR